MEWIHDHPELLRSIIARSSGAIGELLLVRQLEKRGYRARPASINARQCDLLVTSPAGREFSVEVKTVKGRGAPWLVRNCPDETASACWVFIHAPRADDGLPPEEGVSYRLLSTRHAAQIWREKFEGRPNKAPDITWKDLGAMPGGADPHLDRWDILPA
ncbi:MAG TPA: hypothetical protein VI168_10100 [Croceibacterium sp.]